MASRAAVALKGGRDAEKQYEADESLWWDTIAESDTQKPPTVASALDMEAQTSDTSVAFIPQCSKHPLPDLPSTPNEPVSSKSTRNLYWFASSTTCFKLQMCPVERYSPSTIMKRLNGHTVTNMHPVRVSTIQWQENACAPLVGYTQEGSGVGRLVGWRKGAAAANRPTCQIISRVPVAKEEIRGFGRNGAAVTC